MWAISDMLREKGQHATIYQIRQVMVDWLSANPDFKQRLFGVKDQPL